MAVEGIGNLVQSLAKLAFGPTQDAPGANSPGAVKAVVAAVTEDRFTPSTQNDSAQATAQDAGIFQLSPAAQPSIAANILFGQTALGSSQNGAPAPGAPAPVATNARAPEATAAVNSSAPANTSPQSTGTTSAAQAATSAAAAADVRNKIQALNAALPALGLTNEEIQQIDRIASIVQNFNPAAYADLVNQFEALAQQASQPSPATAIPPNSAAPVNINPTTTRGGFQVQGIVFKLAAPQANANSDAANGSGPGAAANSQTNPAGLRIEQTQFILTDGYGQTVKLQVPQQNAAAGSGSQQETPIPSTAA